MATKRGISGRSLKIGLAIAAVLYVLTVIVIVEQAHAAEATAPADRCAIIASFASTAATARNDGVPKDKFMEAFSAFSSDSGLSDSTYLFLSVLMSIVYDSAHTTESAFSSAYTACKSAFSEDGAQ